jgi:NADH-quinone oxidoreductase subunit C
MHSAAIIDVLSRTLPPDRLEIVESPDGMPTIYVEREELVTVCRALRDDPDLRFVVLLDIIPADYFPREPRFELSYLLLSPGIAGYGKAPKRLRVKVRLPGENARVPTVSAVWKSAGWAEREAFDLFGIHVEGHPDLRRILMPEDWEGYPMRKDYPVQIKQPVKTYEPLQISPEQFVTNIEAARDRSKR